MTTIVKDNKKLEDRLAKRVESATSWDDFMALIPSLHVVDNLNGKNQAGLAMRLDERHKVAVHEFPDGKFQTVPTLRSENYKELAHDYVYDTLHNVLDQAGLGHKVLSHRMVKSSGELHADIVLDKAYKMDEDNFEKDMGVSYTDGDKKNVGLYRPIIRVRSSFIQSSEVIMGLLRVVCSNGMIGVELGESISVPLRFSHVGDVVSQFDKGVDQLITGLFEKNIIENMMMRLQADQLSFATIVEWMLANIGKQATLASVDQFHLEDKVADDMVSKWVAYNMASWAMSNVIESVNRRNKAQRSLSMLMNS